MKSIARRSFLSSDIGLWAPCCVIAGLIALPYFATDDGPQAEKMHAAWAQVQTCYRQVQQMHADTAHVKIAEWTCDEKERNYHETYGMRPRNAE